MVRPEAVVAPICPRVLPPVAVLEAGLTAIEIAWIGLPLWAAASDFGTGLALTPATVTLAVALWLASLLRLTAGLRPVAMLLRTRERRATIAPGSAEAIQRSTARLPLESALLRFVSWIGVATAVLLLPRGDGSPQALPIAGLLSSAVLHSAGAAALRALLLGRLLSRLRAAAFPTVEGMRVFAASYRSWLVMLGALILGLAHFVVSLLAMSVLGISPTQRAALTLLAWPVLLPGGALWIRSLMRRTRALESYFDVTLRSPGTRGPARDEPKAVVAFKAAQALSYRLGTYQGFVMLLAGLGAVAFSRRLLSLPLRAGVALLGATALVVLLGALYQMLLSRQVLRPVLRHLGSRHALPVAEIRSRVSLADKLLGVFLVVAVGAGALVALAMAAPPERSIWAAAGVALGAVAVVGLVLLVTRELVQPIQALETRSEEMARGELARPLPASGEADEIGRLAVVFEEMRRALRDRLRSTESINVDLEREVRRRTEALEQKNAELRTALEKLRRAQDNLVRSEKLASMGRLVAGIAHEINNPVNAVINSLGPLGETIHEIAEDPRSAGELARSAEEMLSVIQRGAARTKAIVQALHNYSRGDDSAARDVNLGRSVDDTVDLLRHRLRNVTVVKEVEPGARVMGFAGQIDQVLMNLLTNAAQALGDSGGTIRIGARSRMDAVEVYVKDDGPGIPADVLPRIFDPFFTTKDVGEGSGLGLSIVHGIVDRHGGKIEVESVVGQGTTFRILFPHATVRDVTVRAGDTAAG